MLLAAHKVLVFLTPQPGKSGMHTNNDPNKEVKRVQAPHERILLWLDMYQADGEAGWHKHKDGQAQGEVAWLEMLQAQLWLGPRLTSCARAIGFAGSVSNQRRRRLVSGQLARRKATTCAGSNAREGQVSERRAVPAACSLDAVVPAMRSWTTAAALLIRAAATLVALRAGRRHRQPHLRG